MILVDTSVWADHLGRSNPHMLQLLEHNDIVSHPFVEGEIALGSLRQRRQVLSSLAQLPRLPVMAHVEVLAFVESHGLPGSGVGYVDAHLLASAYAAGDVALWSRDKRLNAVAARLRLSAAPPFYT